MSRPQFGRWQSVGRSSTLCSSRALISGLKVARFVVLGSGSPHGEDDFGPPVGHYSQCFLVAFPFGSLFSVQSLGTAAPRKTTACEKLKCLPELLLAGVSKTYHLTANSPMTCPAAFIRHASCLASAQSMPSKTKDTRPPPLFGGIRGVGYPCQSLSPRRTPPDGSFPTDRTPGRALSG